MTGEERLRVKALRAEREEERAALIDEYEEAVALSAALVDHGDRDGTHWRKWSARRKELEFPAGEAILEHTRELLDDLDVTVGNKSRSSYREELVDNLIAHSPAAVRAALMIAIDP